MALQSGRLTSSASLQMGRSGLGAPAASMPAFNTTGSNMPTTSSVSKPKSSSGSTILLSSTQPMYSSSSTGPVVSSSPMFLNAPTMKMSPGASTTPSASGNISFGYSGTSQPPTSPPRPAEAPQSSSAVYQHVSSNGTVARHFSGNVPSHKNSGMNSGMMLQNYPTGTPGTAPTSSGPRVIYPNPNTARPASTCSLQPSSQFVSGTVPQTSSSSSSVYYGSSPTHAGHPSSPAIQSAINSGRIYAPIGGTLITGTSAFKSGLNPPYNPNSVLTFEMPVMFGGSGVSSCLFQSRGGEYNVPLSQQMDDIGVTSRGMATTSPSASAAPHPESKPSNQNFVVLPHRRSACC